MKKTPQSPLSFTHDVPETALQILAQFLYQDILDFYQSEEGTQYRVKSCVPVFTLIRMFF